MKPVKITAEFTITPEDYERYYKKNTQEWNERNTRNYRGREENIEMPEVTLKVFHDFVTKVLYWKFGIHASWRKIKNTTTTFSEADHIPNVQITCNEET